MVKENEIYTSSINGVSYRIICIGGLIETFSWEVTNGTYSKVKKVHDLREGKLLTVEVKKGGGFRYFDLNQFIKGVDNGTLKLVK